MRRFVAWLGPDFGLVVGFLSVLTVLVCAYGGSFRWKEGPILISAGIGAGIVLVRWIWQRRRLGDLVRDVIAEWGPFIAIMWLFQNLELFTGIVRTTSIDAQLYAADVALFGGEPSVWLSHHQTPLLTDYMALAYGLYFITPMILATMLSLRGRRHDFRVMSTAVILQLGIGFLLFLIFPAGPPRYYPLPFDPPQLHSYFGLFELQQGAFDSADPLRMRSAFPSLHCSLALITLYCSLRYSDAVFPRHPRLWGRIVIVEVVSLWLSVVYLRHHWFVDIFAGLALGAFSLWLTPRLRAWWPARLSVDH